MRSEGEREGRETRGREREERENRGREGGT